MFITNRFLLAVLITPEEYGEKINELREQFRTGELNIVCQYCLNHTQSEIWENIREERK